MAQILSSPLSIHTLVKFPPLDSVAHFYQVEYSKSKEMSLLKLDYKKTPSMLLISLVLSTDCSDENPLSYGEAHIGQEMGKKKQKNC